MYCMHRSLTHPSLRTLTYIPPEYCDFLSLLLILAPSPTHFRPCSLKHSATLLNLPSSCPSPGDLLTAATWMRQFITKHPDYKSDSVVSEKITYDLFCQVDKMASREEQCPELTGKLQSRAQPVLVQCPTKSMELGAGQQDTPTSATN